MRNFGGYRRHQSQQPFNEYYTNSCLVQKNLLKFMIEREIRFKYIQYYTVFEVWNSLISSIFVKMSILNAVSSRFESR